METWRDCHCKIWCPIHTILWAILTAISLFLFAFLSLYPPVQYSAITPTYLVHRGILEINASTNSLDWFSDFSFKVSKCAGNVLVFPQTNCSVLDQARFCSGDPLLYNNWLGGANPLYFLEDSYVTIDYNAITDNRSFVVLKSTRAIELFQRLCEDLNDTIDGVCVNTKTVAHICLENRTIDPYLRENLWCFVNVQGQLSRFEINQSDFYTVAYNSSRNTNPPLIRGSLCVYRNSTIYSLESVQVYPSIALEVKDSYQFSFPLLGKPFSFGAEQSCRVLQYSCNESYSLHQVEYHLERRRDLLVFPVLLFLLCLILLVGVACAHHVKYKRSYNRPAGNELDK